MNSDLISLTHYHQPCAAGPSQNQKPKTTKNNWIFLSQCEAVTGPTEPAGKLNIYKICQINNLQNIFICFYIGPTGPSDPTCPSGHAGPFDPTGPTGPTGFQSNQ